MEWELGLSDGVGVTHSEDLEELAELMEDVSHWKAVGLLKKRLFCVISLLFGVTGGKDKCYTGENKQNYAEAFEHLIGMQPLSVLEKEISFSHSPGTGLLHWLGFCVCSPNAFGKGDGVTLGREKQRAQLWERFQPQTLR